MSNLPYDPNQEPSIIQRAHHAFESANSLKAQVGLGVADRALDTFSKFKGPNVKEFEKLDKVIGETTKKLTTQEKLLKEGFGKATKDVEKLHKEALKGVNDSLDKLTKGFKDLPKIIEPTDNVIGKFRKSLQAVEHTMEKIAGVKFGIDSVKILTGAFVQLGDEIARVNSTMQIMAHTGVDPSVIASVKEFQQAILSFDSANVEQMATGFVAQYAHVTEKLSHIGTIIPHTIHEATGKGIDYLGDYFDKLQNMVDKSLKNTVSSIQAVDATYTALQAGIGQMPDGTMNEAVVDKTVGDALKLVATQGGDVNQIMELLVQTMTAFGMSTNSSAEILSKLTMLVDVGITSIPELSSGFGQLGVTASSAGVTLDEMTGSLAALTLAGSNTFSAMTSLQNVYNKIISGSVSDRLAEMNATLNGQAVRLDAATVSSKGFVQALDDVNRAIGGSKEGWQKIMGGDQEATRGVLGLLKKDVEGLADLIDQISNTSASFLEEAFNVKINTDQVMQFSQAINKVTETVLKLGKILTPLFSKGLDRINTYADRLDYLVKNYGDVILKVVELQLALKTLNGVFGILLGTMGKLLGAYIAYLTISGKLFASVLKIGGVLATQNAAVKENNVLWSKNTSMMQKVVAVIGQLLGFYDIEKTSKDNLTKADQERINKQVEERAIKAAAHKETMAQLEAELAMYKQVDEVRAGGGNEKQQALKKLFDEGDDAKVKVKETAEKQKEIGKRLVTLNDLGKDVDSEIEIVKKDPKRSGELVALEETRKDIKKEQKEKMEVLKEVKEEQKKQQEIIRLSHRVDKNDPDVQLVKMATDRSKKQQQKEYEAKETKDYLDANANKKEFRGKVSRLSGRLGAVENITVAGVNIGDVTTMADNFGDFYNKFADDTSTFEQTLNKMAEKIATPFKWITTGLEKLGEGIGKFAQKMVKLENLPTTLTSIGIGIAAAFAGIIAYMQKTADGSRQRLEELELDTTEIVGPLDALKKGFVDIGEGISISAKQMDKNKALMITNPYMWLTAKAVNVASDNAKEIAGANAIIEDGIKRSAFDTQYFELYNRRNQLSKMQNATSGGRLDDVEVELTIGGQQVKQRANVANSIAEALAKENLTTEDVANVSSVISATKQQIQQQAEDYSANVGILEKNAQSQLSQFLERSGLNKDQKNKLEDYIRYAGSYAEQGKVYKATDEERKAIEKLTGVNIEDQKKYEDYKAMGDTLNEEQLKEFQRIQEAYLKKGADLDRQVANTRDIEQTKKQANEMQEAANNIAEAFTGMQSFIKNLQDIGDTNNPDGKRAINSFNNTAEQLGSTVSNFAETMMALMGQGKYTQEELLRMQQQDPEQYKKTLEESGIDLKGSGNIMTEIARLVPNLVEQLSANGAMGYTSDINKADQFREVLQKQVTGQLTAAGFSDDFAKKATDALLADQKIREQIMALEESDHQRRLERIEKEASIYRAFKQSEFYTTQSVVKNIQKLEQKSVEESLAFAKKRLDELKSLDPSTVDKGKIQEVENEYQTLINQRFMLQLTQIDELTELRIKNLEREKKAFAELKNYELTLTKDVLERTQNLERKVIDERLRANLDQQRMIANKRKRSPEDIEAMDNLRKDFQNMQAEQYILELNQVDEDTKYQQTNINRNKIPYELAQQNKYTNTLENVRQLQNFDKQSLNAEYSGAIEKLELLKNAPTALYDPEAIRNAEQEIINIRTQKTIQQINQIEELLDIGTKNITDKYDKQYAEIMVSIAKGESSISDDDRIKLETKKNEEILRINIKAKEELLSIFRNSGRNTLALEADLNRDRLALINNFVETANKQYQNYAKQIENATQRELNALRKSERSLETRASMIDKVDSLISRQSSISEEASSFYVRDLGTKADNAKSEREKKEIQLEIIKIQEQSAIRQLKNEHESLKLQHRKKDLELEILEIRQKQAEITAKSELQQAVLTEQQLRSDPNASQVDIEAAQLRTQSAAIGYDATLAEGSLLGVQKEINRREKQLDYTSITNRETAIRVDSENQRLALSPRSGGSWDQKIRWVGENRNPTNIGRYSQPIFQTNESLMSQISANTGGNVSGSDAVIASMLGGSQNIRDQMNAGIKSINGTNTAEKKEQEKKDDKINIEVKPNINITISTQDQKQIAEDTARKIDQHLLALFNEAAKSI